MSGMPQFFGKPAPGRFDAIIHQLGPSTTYLWPAPVTAPETPTLALPDKSSIAVLPFANMSGDAEQEYFADGITKDIITMQPGRRTRVRQLELALDRGRSRLFGRSRDRQNGADGKRGANEQSG